MRRLLALASLLLAAACVAPGPAPGQKYAIFFQEWSAQLDAPAKGTIAAAADFARQHPEQRLTVTGFADPTGSPQANVDLSRLRAQVVSDGLVAAGLSPDRIRRASRGATEFALSSQESRRVEIGFAP